MERARRKNHRIISKLPKRLRGRSRLEYASLGIIGLSAIVGLVTVVTTHAATFVVALEAESGNLAGNQAAGTATGASDSAAIRFGSTGGGGGGGGGGNPTGGSLLHPASDYATHSNLTYGPEDSNQLDLFIPNSTGPHPLVVYVHGGAWLEGDKSECFPKEFGMIERGFAVACIDYRLTAGGSVPFPAQIIDVKSAIRYLRANAAQYGIYAAKIGVMGASAGGHLADMAGTSGGFADFDKGDNLGQSSTVQAVCSFYGPSDLLSFVQEFSDHDQASQPEPMLLGENSVSGFPDKARYASPTTYVDASDPPFLLYHGTSDGTVPPQQSQLLDQKLRAAGVSSTLHMVSGLGHADPGFEDGRYNDEVSNFFDQILR